MSDHEPRRGDRVQAVAYYAPDEAVTGRYVPREDHADTEPPTDAAWVDTGGPGGPTMVKAYTVQSADTLRTVAEAAATSLTQAAAKVSRLRPSPRPGATAPEEGATPDPRRVAIEVTVDRPFEGVREIHTHGDVEGMAWTTYGDSHTPTLDVVDGQGRLVATYPAGSWVSVRYPLYGPQGVPQ